MDDLNFVSSDESSDDEQMNDSDDYDDYDDGFESGLDIEDIIVNRRYPLPIRPPYQIMYPSDEEEEAVAMRGGRRLYDRFPHSSRNVSRGDDDDNDRGSALRNVLRNSSINGLDITDKDTLIAKRVTGMAVRNQKIIYFVQFVQKGHESFPMDETVMRIFHPQLLVEFHEKIILNPKNYERL